MWCMYILTLTLKIQFVQTINKIYHIRMKMIQAIMTKIQGF